MASAVRGAAVCAACAVVMAAAAAGSASAATSGPPALPVHAAALIEESSGQPLYADNANAELPIGSTTKLMTALVTLHHAQLRDVFTNPHYSLAPVDTQIGLKPGERMSVHDLLIAMLLPSADDAAEDLAYNVGHGSVGRFLAMMNARARQLGLNHTHYTTPIGVDTPGNYSSALDLVMLARYVLRSEPFVKVVVAKKNAVLRTGNHVLYVANLNDLLDRYSWINGVKPGHTPDAGYVLVASGTRQGMTLIDAVLGASSQAACDASALALLNYGFATFRVRTPVRAGEVLAQPQIAGYTNRRAQLVASEAYTHVFPKSAQIHLRVHAPGRLMGPLAADTEVGWVTVMAGGRVLIRIPLQVAQAVPSNQYAGSVRRGGGLLSATLSGLVLAAGAAISRTMFWREWRRG